jgi:hypothetical protein
MRTRRWTLVPLLEAEFVLGLRLAGRHPVARSALAWTVGLAAIARAVAGHAAFDRTAPITVALAGLLAAAAVPPLFVRGGALETLRWTRGRVVAACLARLHGALAIALVGAGGAGVVLGGRPAVSFGVLGAALLHAALVGAVAGALAPRAGCAFATVSTLLVVAAGAGASEFDPLEPAPPLWTPPGALAVRLLAGGGGHVPLLAGWIALGILGMWSVAHRAAPMTGGARAHV